jgi:hypothetical protein
VKAGPVVRETSNEPQSNVLSFLYLRKSCIAKSRCEGSPCFRYVLQTVAGTHWSEDTLGLPLENLARCVLPPRSSKVFSCANFLLFTYSVFGEKNVSQENKNTPWDQSGGWFCPRHKRRARRHFPDRVQESRARDVQVRARRWVIAIGRESTVARTLSGDVPPEGSRFSLIRSRLKSYRYSYCEQGEQPGIESK